MQYIIYETEDLGIVWGASDKENSMHRLFTEQGLECHNYDLKDGAHCDLTDDAVWDPILRDSAAGEYRACFASPECGTFFPAPQQAWRTATAAGCHWPW